MRHEKETGFDLRDYRENLAVVNDEPSFKLWLLR